MRKGQRSRSTRDAEDLAEHFEIKPKATEPRTPSCQNDALRRHQFRTDDPRWATQPPYGWVDYDPALHCTAGSRCWYCSGYVRSDEKALYSKTLCMLCHAECHGAGDTMTPNRATPTGTETSGRQ